MIHSDSVKMWEAETAAMRAEIADLRAEAEQLRALHETPDLSADLAVARAEIERLTRESNQPHLGLATTRELLDELRARIEMHALGGLDYRTVDGN